MGKKGTDTILSVYWFLILFLVAGAVVYMTYQFYGTPFNIQGVESKLLGDQVLNCITSNGYLNNSVFSADFKDNFLSNCHINLNVEDIYDWKSQSQYYIELEIYKFNSTMQYYGESQNYVPSIFGDQLLDIIAGNVNLKTIWGLSLAKSSGIFSSLNKRNVNTIVIHATEGGDTIGAIQAISEADLSIHYMIDRDGTIISVNNENEFAPAQYSNAFVPESTIAQHVGCFNTRSNSAYPTCSPNCIDPNGLLDANCQQLSNPPQSSWCCINGFNPKSIGIELVNLQSLCSSANYKNSVYCQNSVTADGKQWENYSQAQINSLVNLVSEIASRYNIPIDRNHIIGHYQVNTYKTDPGPEFPWNQFMQDLQKKGVVSSSSFTSSENEYERSAYVLDSNGNPYLVKVLALIGKTEKNEKS